MSFVVVNPNTPFTDLIKQGQDQYLALIRLYAAIKIPADALHQATVSVGSVYIQFKNAVAADDPHALAEAVSELMNFKIPDNINAHVNAVHAPILAVDHTHI